MKVIIVFSIMLAMCCSSVNAEQSKELPKIASVKQSMSYNVMTCEQALVNNVIDCNDNNYTVNIDTVKSYMDSNCSYNADLLKTAFEIKLNVCKR